MVNEYDRNVNLPVSDPPADWLTWLILHRKIPPKPVGERVSILPFVGSYGQGHTVAVKKQEYMRKWFDQKDGIYQLTGDPSLVAGSWPPAKINEIYLTNDTNTKHLAWQMFGSEGGRVKVKTEDPAPDEFAARVLQGP